MSLEIRESWFPYDYLRQQTEVNGARFLGSEASYRVIND